MDRKETLAIDISVAGQNDRTLRARAKNPKVDRAYLVPMLVKSLHVLAAMRESGTSMTVSDLSCKLGYSKSSVYRILRTFVAHGVLPEHEEGSYKIRGQRILNA